MTYDASEKSLQDGAPVEIYTFARNAKIWRYTSSEQNVTFEGDVYLSATLQRSKIETNPEQARNALDLTVPRDFELAALYRPTPPTDIIALTVRRYHRDDEDPAVIWIGRILNVSSKGPQSVIHCEPISSSMKRTGLRRLYQKACPHVLYSAAPGCGVDKTAHDITTTVTALSGVTVTVAALLDKPYAGGYIERIDGDGNYERRFIRSFDGLELTLSQRFVTAEIGDSVVIYPGCNHTMETCNTVYANLDNYGGMPYIPTKNPFDGTPVY